MKSKLLKQALILALGGTSLIALGTPALAQDAPASANSGQIEEIIVSARRRTESLNSTPIAITAITTSQLENKASINLGDLMGAAPNLLITQQNSGGAAANLAIRGMTYADIEKSQEPTVGVVVDGVFIGTSTGQFMDFFDIAQIEVLRGPQGTLFGRNTIGGVISIKRSRPTGEIGGKIELGYGSFNSFSGRAVLNAPISDNLFVKAFYFHTQNDGFHKDSVTGKRRGGSNNENFGLTFLAKPTENFEALLTLEKQVQDFDVVNSNIAQTGEVFCAFEPANECNRNNTTDLYTIFGQQADSSYQAPAITLEMNADAGAIKLTSVTSYRESDENQTQDFDASTTDLYYTRRVQDYHQFSQELRAAGQIMEKFDYVIGGYYFKSRFKLQQWSRVFGFNPTVDPTVTDTNSQTVIGNTESLAFFGDFNWEVVDRVRLSFGGRWTQDKKELNNSFAATGVVGAGKKTFNKFTPKVGLDFRPNDDMLFYGSWSRGYRSGGFSPRAATAITANVPYLPETVDSYEIGTKLVGFDRRVELNVAAFYAKYKGLQQNTTIPGGPTGNQTITSNVGSADVKGIEVDFIARATPELTFRGAAGFLDNKFKGFIAGNTTPLGVIKNFDYSNNEPIYSPDLTASLNAEYAVPVSFGQVTANVGYRYIGAYEQQISVNPATDFSTATVIVKGNDPRVRTKAQSLLDISLTTAFNMGDQKAKFTLYARNLTDNRGTSAAFTVAGLWSFASAREPRAFGGTLGFEF
jgi:iron complex outermembrane recepter protein